MYGSLLLQMCCVDLPLSNQLVVAALHDIKSGIPGDGFVIQLEKLKALQLRIFAVFDSMKVIEARLFTQ